MGEGIDTIAGPASIGGLDVRRASESAPNMNFMIYGDPGVGKTVLAGSSSEVESMAPVLLIDVEGGTISLNNTYPNVDIVRVQNSKQLNKVYQELRKEDHGYRTVVIDSLTEMQKLMMVELMQQVVKEDTSRDPEVPSLREWGKNIEQTRRIVRNFRDLEVNTVYTAHAMYDKDDKRARTRILPSFSGKLANEVAGFVDIVGYYYPKVKGGKEIRVLLTGGTEDTVAKDRTGTLPKFVSDPTMKTLWGYFTGEMSKENENG